MKLICFYLLSFRLEPNGIGIPVCMSHLRVWDLIVESLSDVELTFEGFRCDMSICVCPYSLAHMRSMCVVPPCMGAHSGGAHEENTCIRMMRIA